MEFAGGRATQHGKIMPLLNSEPAQCMRGEVVELAVIVAQGKEPTDVILLLSDLS